MANLFPMSNLNITQKIIPHIWFETEAMEAANFYVDIFENSQIYGNTVLNDTPSETDGGQANIINLNLSGSDFQFISAGPLFDRNPSFSYMVSCSYVEEVDRIWSSLVEGAEVLMPLDKYDFSEKFGWLNDKFGVSWQIMHDGSMQIQKITPSLLFTGQVAGKAEEAAKFYTSIFDDSKILEDQIMRYGPNETPEIEGNLAYCRVQLCGREFVLGDSSNNHKFEFNEMNSLIIYCKTQKEIDYYWEKLSKVPEAQQCGWVKDQFGISWQIVPTVMEEMMKKGTKQQIDRVTQAFLQMKKFDIETLEKAFNL